MVIEYPGQLIERLSNLESDISYSSVEVANAISFSNWENRPAYKDIFFCEPAEELTRLLKCYDLEPTHENSGVERTDCRFNENLYERSNISWSHFISTFSAYDISRRSSRKNYLDFVIDPGLKILGVDVEKMMSGLDPALKRSYLFTLGGDILQDHIFDFESPWDYRGDILGLCALQENMECSGNLSDFVEEAYRKKETVEGEAFRQHPLYLEAKRGSDTRRMRLLRRVNVMKIYDYIVSGVRLKRSIKNVD